MLSAFKMLPEEDQEYLWGKMSDVEKIKYGKYRRKKKSSPTLFLR